MNIVLRHIEYLLSVHECVVVPGLGAFLAADYSAEYNAQRGFYMSPGRRFAFNESLNTSDGLLVMSIARAQAIDFNSAKRIVGEAVYQIKSELNSVGEFNFGRIGRLEKSESGSIRFIPSPIDRLSPLSGWIGNLELQQLNVGVEDETAENTNQERPFNHIQIPRFIRTAVGAAAAIFLALVVSTPVNVKNTYQASTVPNLTKPRAIEVPVAVSQPVVDTVPECPAVDETDCLPEVTEQPMVALQTNPYAQAAAMAAVDATMTTEPKKETVEAPDPLADLRFDEMDPFVLVVASLPTIDDAARFIEETKRRTNIKLGIVESQSWFQIYAATGKTKQDAQKLHSRLSKRFPGAWVKER